MDFFKIYYLIPVYLYLLHYSRIATAFIATTDLEITYIYLTLFSNSCFLRDMAMPRPV